MFVISFTNADQIAMYRGISQLVTDLEYAMPYDSIEACLIGAVAMRECFPGLVNPETIGIIEYRDLNDDSDVGKALEISELPWQAAQTALHQYD